MFSPLPFHTRTFSTNVTVTTALVVVVRRRRLRLREISRLSVVKGIRQKPIVNTGENDDETNIFSPLFTLLQIVTR